MKRILLSVPHMGGGEMKYVEEAFRTNWLSTVGANLTGFEEAMEERVGVPVVALGSGTAGIHLGLKLMGVGVGDEVMCQSLTFAASANPIRYCGAEPVFVDSERESWNMDPEVLRGALKARAARGKLPKAVEVVHLFGQCADMDGVMGVCGEFGVGVLEDAAEALGGWYWGAASQGLGLRQGFGPQVGPQDGGQGCGGGEVAGSDVSRMEAETRSLRSRLKLARRAAGTMGDVGVYSFNGNKIITTTGGGMLASRRADWVAKARHWATQARDAGVAYEHSELGYNYRMSNVLAGIGRGQLEVLDLRVEQRRAVARRYSEGFADLEGIEMMPEARHGLHTRWLSVFLIDEAKFGCTRDELIRELDEAGVESRPVWKPMHLQRLYEGCEMVGGGVAEDLYRRGICLPSSSCLTDDEQAYVIGMVRAAAGAGVRVN